MQWLWNIHCGMRDIRKQNKKCCREKKYYKKLYKNVESFSLTTTVKHRTVSEIRIKKKMTKNIKIPKRLDNLLLKYLFI